MNCISYINSGDHMETTIPLLQSLNQQRQLHKKEALLMIGDLLKDKKLKRKHQPLITLVTINLRNKQVGLMISTTLTLSLRLNPQMTLLTLIILENLNPLLPRIILMILITLVDNNQMFLVNKIKHHPSNLEIMVRIIKSKGDNLLFEINFAQSI